MRPLAGRQPVDGRTAVTPALAQPARRPPAAGCGRRAEGSTAQAAGWQLATDRGGPTVGWPTS